MYGEADVRAFGDPSAKGRSSDQLNAAGEFVEIRHDEDKRGRRSKMYFFLRSKGVPRYRNATGPLD